jgi:hypothetical protein
MITEDEIAYVRVPKTASLNFDLEKRMFDGIDMYCIKKEVDEYFLSFDRISDVSYKTNHLSSSFYIKNTNLKYFYTQVRDPYDIACSLYFFLKRKGPYSRVVGSNISVDGYNSVLINDSESVEVYLENVIPNSNYTHYFDILSPSNFDCVGYSNDLGKSVDLLRSIFNLKSVGPTNYNTNPDKFVGEPYNFDYSRNEFKKNNEQEYELYYQALEKFTALCKRYLY